LGSFADAHVPEFSETHLAQYEEILGYSDPDLYDWMTGKAAPPANYINDVFSLLLEHRFAT
jgi:antitoxin CptB